MAPLLVIDADSLGHRAYHAMPEVDGAAGRPVGLLVGSPTCCSRHGGRHSRAPCWCASTRARRPPPRAAAGLPGKRDPFADDLCEQLDRLADLTEAFGFAAAKVLPYEADDLLATAVTLEEARGGGALVVSGDRDMSSSSRTDRGAPSASARRAGARRSRRRARALRRSSSSR